MTSLRPPSEDALADEGMLVVAAALRLALKNRLILRAVAERADFDEGWLFESSGARSPCSSPRRRPRTCGSPE
ncbi:hypothetical protein [Naasia aerilata]|uniref:Uncharacterized protein n=1 Tax=Naasia aerilata TaxID=1162966 RepID=A0ABM8G8N5_9MICO|nr:hypothetical protein [Naasia aerilata]BDZ44526.1 hypothetical protein GCM10025866_04350 [Naasia aerilata]